MRSPRKLPGFDTRWARSSRASRLLVPICLALLLPETSLGARPREREAAVLVRALEATRRCHGVWLVRGRGPACHEIAPPETWAELYENVVALAFGPDDPGDSPWTGSDLAPQRRCQLAIQRAVTRHVTVLLRRGVRRFGAARGSPLVPAPHFAAVEAHCDVEVRGAAGGTVLPWVGEQCAAAVGGAGERVNAPALRTCLQTLVASWVDRATSSPSRRPSIVVLLTDDQRFDTVDATHSPDDAPSMPAVFDRLASEGVRFRNTFVTNPVCGPSRASILTGQHVFRHGVYRNDGETGGAHFDDASTLATWLHAAGYRTGFYGKYMNFYADRWDPAVEPPYVPPGWDDWRAFLANKSIEHYGFSMVENGEIVEYAGEENYSTDVMARQVFAFVDEAARTGRPFFVLFSTAAPHFPYQPAARHEGSFASAPAWHPPAYFEEDVSDKPRWVRALPRWNESDHATVQAWRRAQLEMLAAIDEFVDALMDRLEASGLAEDTVIVFTSDNGHAWGEHRWNSKACPWEECLRVPLIVRYPRLAPLPREEDGIALNIDLAPTLAELAGVPLPPDRDGRSLVRAIDGTDRDPREDFLIESYSGLVRTYVGVREREWKYVEYLTGDEELYDLAQDPWELENRAADPEQVDRVARLRARVRELWPGWPAIDL